VLVPLAALAVPGTMTGAVPGPGSAPLAAEATAVAYGGDPVAFLSALARVVLAPLLTLLHAGVALEAHGQNTLIALRDGRPVRLLYRDVGGVRISVARLRAAGIQPPPLRGDLPTDDPDTLRTKLAASVGIALAEQVTVLARHTGTEPARLWQAVRGAAESAYGDLPDAAAGDRAALLGRPLPVKATTAMRLADDPLADVWAELPHPLGGPR
jgi:siderophore synthetase component